nr:hypothetical protein [Abalone asfa-like virus]
MSVLTHSMIPQITTYWSWKSHLVVLNMAEKGIVLKNVINDNNNRGFDRIVVLGSTKIIDWRPLSHQRCNYTNKQSLDNIVNMLKKHQTFLRVLEDRNKYNLLIDHEESPISCPISCPDLSERKYFEYPPKKIYTIPTNHILFVNIPHDIKQVIMIPLTNMFNGSLFSIDLEIRVLKV